MKNLKIVVIGFFDRCNLGDETFKLAINKVGDEIKSYLELDDIEIKYICIDELINLKYDEIFNYDLLLIGPGDVLNDYFLNRINEFLIKGKIKIPIFSISVGGNSNILLNNDKTYNIDYIITRSKYEKELLLKNNFNSDWVDELSDITTILTFPKQSNIEYKILKDNERLKIGLFVAQPFSKILFINNNFNELIKFMEDQIKINKVKWILYSFNNYEISDSECDFYLMKKIYESIKEEFKEFVYLDFRQLNFFDMTMEISNLNAAVCMRFHSHVFCTMCNIPFISISKTRKTELFMKENNLEKQLLIFNDKKSLLCIELNQIFQNLVENLNYEQDNLSKISFNLNEKSKNYSKMISNKLKQLKEFETINFFNLENNIKRFDPIKFINVEDINNLRYQTLKSVMTYIKKRYGFEKYIDNNFLNSMVKIIFNSNNFNYNHIIHWMYHISNPFQKTILIDQKNKLNNQNQNQNQNQFLLKSFDFSITINIENLFEDISKIIVFFITGKLLTKYNYGLSEKIKNLDWQFKDSWDWIIYEYQKNENNLIMFNLINSSRDYLIKNFYNYRNNFYNKNINFNLFTIDQFNPQNNNHRSGWKYVTSNLLGLHNFIKPNIIINEDNYYDISNSCIIDFYCDCTFGWNSQFYERINIIPYKTKWFGFFHHTFIENITNNMFEILKKKSFLESLNSCKGLITLSKDLKIKIETNLEKIKQTLPTCIFNIPPVFYLYHPTEFVSKIWNLDLFLSNEKRRVVQIGGWLRNSYAIYNIHLENNYKNKLNLTKSILKGKNMENYFRKEDNNTQLILDPSKNKWIAIEKLINLNEIRINNLSSNSHYLGIIENLNKQFDSVEILSTLSNDDYDSLLEKNIVFIELIEPSAVNTIIECIVRNIPICINPHPAVIEYLGENYPFYFSCYSEASDKLNDLEIIKNTNQYLLKMDKNFLKLETFIENLFLIIQNNF